MLQFIFIVFAIAIIIFLFLGLSRHSPSGIFAAGITMLILSLLLFTTGLDSPWGEHVDVNSSDVNKVLVQPYMLKQMPQSCAGISTFDYKCIVDSSINYIAYLFLAGGLVFSVVSGLIVTFGRK